MKKTALQSGQALLVILLIMAVGLTIGLSLISRSITDIRISQQEKESARAFSAAEAGIEEAIGQDLAIGGSLSGQVGEVGEEIDYYVSARGQGGGDVFDFDGAVFVAGDIQTVWLIEHLSEDEFGDDFLGGTIAICWGENVAEAMAVEVSLIYEAGGDFRVARGAYDSNPGLHNNSFEPALTFNLCGVSNLAFSKSINLRNDFGIPIVSTLYALRIKPLYNATPKPLAVRGSAPFPSQGKCFESTASVGEGDKKITRKVEQCQFHESPPDIFDYLLFSEGGL